MPTFEPNRLRCLRVTGALALASLVTACMSTAEIRAADANRCRSYGFRPGSEAFSQCLLDIDLARDADRRAFVNRPYVGFGFGYGFGPRRIGW